MILGHAENRCISSQGWWSGGWNGAHRAAIKVSRATFLLGLQGDLPPHLPS